MEKLITRIIGIYLNTLVRLFPRLAREQSFRLMCRVKKLPITEEGAVFFGRGETTYLDVYGNRCALHKWGNGPKKLLFLHGWMSHSQRWKKYIEALDPEEFSCYALDAPGHGNSEGDQLHLEMYRDAYEQVIHQIGELDLVVAHSLGNLVAAYQFLYEQQTRVKAYVVMGSPSGMDAIFNYFEETLGLSKEMMKQVHIKVEEVLKIDPQMASLSEFFNRNNKPKLVIHERTDSITPFEPIRAATEGASSLTLHTTEGLDHTLKSDEVRRMVLDFIKENTKEELHVFERV